MPAADAIGLVLRVQASVRRVLSRSLFDTKQLAQTIPELQVRVPERSRTWPPRTDPTHGLPFPRRRISHEWLQAVINDTGLGDLHARVKLAPFASLPDIGTAPGASQGDRWGGGS